MSGSVGEVDFGVMLTAASNDYGLEEEEIPSAVRHLATTAEDAGLDAVVAGDHVAYPEDIPTDYEYSKTGEPPFDTTTPIFDVFQLFSYLSAITEEITLGTNILSVPYRHPVLLAKNCLTTHALSEGRFELGVAPGWLSSEFEALGIPFEERGGRTDEFLELFERIRDEEIVGFDGEYHSFEPLGFYPNPDEPIPILVGGKSGASIRRTAEYGDGWTTIWDKPNDMSETRDRIMRAWSDFDRDGKPEMVVTRPIHVGTDTEMNTDRLFVGEAESIADDIEEYAEAGTTRINLDFYTTDVEAQAEQLERIGDRVLDAL
ncbi:TIGR03619 family F420-dependent LLM class oxidoreductase [Halococcus sediminicola]|uniref:TIGR03619 family F420-dependent LLM class oxidoreductase n=1 Tax=Halococcus sediminicola TaxID=1264579 RepID=UPI00067899B7|nr:TIGR03619 family F420-dependent LLM class oxidoreductase [Halococcus sediminicola]